MIDCFFFIASFLRVEKTDQKKYFEEIGKLVEKHRSAQSLSKVQLAFEIGTSESSIRRIEKGNTNVTIGVLLRISKALEVPLKDLLPDNKL